MNEEFGVLLNEFGVLLNEFGERLSLFGPLLSFFGMRLSLFGLRLSFFGVLLSLFGVLLNVLCEHFSFLDGLLSLLDELLNDLDVGDGANPRAFHQSGTAMPELPEAETVRAQLEPHLVGATIVQTWARLPRITFPDIPALVERTQNQKIVAAKRRGKQIYFPLESGDSLLIHLGMTGKMRVESGDLIAEPPRHVHAIFRLDNGKNWIFTDPRTFGKVGVMRELPFLTQMGPEPLDDDFPVETIVDKLAKRNSKIKAAILDQNLIAGLGNIYADEVCFLAKIHPETRSGQIPREKLRELVNYMAPVLKKAIEQRGATLKDGGYQDTNGEYGTFRPQMYGRTGQDCDSCGATIERGVLGASKTARSFHFCPNCQK